MIEKQRKNSTFIAAFCRANEAKLVGAARFKRIAESYSIDEAVAVLKESGFGGGENYAADEYEKLIAADEADLAAFVKSYAPDDKTELYFLLPYDFYNAEALVKCLHSGFSDEKYTSTEGAYTIGELKDYISGGKDCGIISELKNAIDQANTLLKSGVQSGMQINALFIKAKYACLMTRAKYDFLKDVLSREIIAADISACLRSESEEYAQKMLISVKNGKNAAGLTPAQISALVLKDEVKVKNAFSGSEFLPLALSSLERAKKGMPLTELEKFSVGSGVTLLADKKFTELSGAFVFSSYVYKRKNEISCARLCLTCKANGVNSEEIVKRIIAV